VTAAPVALVSLVLVAVSEARSVPVVFVGAVAVAIFDASDEIEEAMEDTMEDAEAVGLLGGVALTVIGI